MKIPEYQVLTFETHKDRVRFEKSQLAGVEVRNDSERILRVKKEGRMATVQGEKFDPVEILLEKAHRFLPFGKQVDYDFPSGHTYRTTPPCRTPYFTNLAVNDLLDLGRGALAKICQDRPSLALDVEICRVVNQVLLEDSTGLKISYPDERLDFSLLATGCAENDIFFYTEDLTGMPAGRAELDLRFADFARVLDQAKKIVSLAPGSYPFLLTPAILVHGVLKVLEAGFASTGLENGTSPLLKKVGQAILSPRFTLEQEARHVPFDLDGLPAEPTLFIESGVLKKLPVNLQSAGKVKVPATGSRFASGYHCDLRLRPGSRPLDEMIRQIDRGVLLCMSGDLGMGNIINGELSGTIQLGLLVEKGEVIGRIKGRSLAFNFFQAFNAGLGDLSLETLRFGGTSFIDCPYALVHEVAVH